CNSSLADSIQDCFLVSTRSTVGRARTHPSLEKRETWRPPGRRSCFGFVVNRARRLSSGELAPHPASVTGKTAGRNPAEEEGTLERAGRETAPRCAVYRTGPHLPPQMTSQAPKIRSNSVTTSVPQSP